MAEIKRKKRKDARNPTPEPRPQVTVEQLRETIGDVANRLMPSNRSGPPTIRTPEMRAALLRAFEMGAPRLTACAALGIGKTSLMEWMREDPEFAAEVRRCRQRGNLDILANWFDTAKRDWRAGAALLALRDPEHFAANRRVEVTGAGGGPVQHTVQVIEVPAQLDAAAWNALPIADVAAADPAGDGEP